MKKYYRLICNSNHYQTVVRPPELPIDWVNQFDGRSYLDTWQPLSMAWYEENTDEKKTRDKADFSQFSAHLPVITKHAWDIISTLIEGKAEYLAIDMTNLSSFSESYGLLNVINIISALDKEKSVFSLFEGGRIMHVSHFAFIDEVIGNNDIFRISDYEISGVFVTEKFRRLVEEKALTGLRWEELI